MYRTAVLWIFLLVLAIAGVDLAIRIVRRRPRVPRMGQGAGRYLRAAINLGAFAALVAISLTGFSPVFSHDNEMSGDRLIWHVTMAPAFALAAVAITLIWAHKNRFAPGDPWPVFARKFFFWCAVALAVPAMLSILAAMFPLFGTDDQEELFRIHRYCAPLLAGAGLLFAWFALVTWREGRKE